MMGQVLVAAILVRLVPITNIQGSPEWGFSMHPWELAWFFVNHFSVAVLVLRYLRSHDPGWFRFPCLKECSALRLQRQATPLNCWLFLFV
jgi:hypothetical protein